MRRDAAIRQRLADKHGIPSEGLPVTSKEELLLTVAAGNEDDQVRIEHIESLCQSLGIATLCIGRATDANSGDTADVLSVETLWHDEVVTLDRDEWVGFCHMVIDQLAPLIFDDMHRFARDSQAYEILDREGLT